MADPGDARQQAADEGTPEMETTAPQSSVYRTLVADPPWRYDDGFVTMTGAGTRKRRADGALLKRSTKPLPYPSLTVDEIAALPVSALAAPDAALWLWTTNRYLHDAFHVVSAWGFTYTQTIVWAKGKRSPFVASVAPNHAEFLLVARRGNLRWAGALDTNVVDIAFSANDKRARHSRKPDAFLDDIERVSPGLYLELFARRQRLGWDTWGNEALEHVEVA